MPKKVPGILRTSFENVPLRRGSTVKFQNRLKRAKTNAHEERSNQKFGKDMSNLVLSGATSNASYTVMSQTGMTP